MSSFFHNKTALITGGTKGIGFATARALAEKGVRLALGYRSDESTAETQLRSLPGAGHFLLKADLSLPGECDRMWDEFFQHSKQIDFYIHNAAATAFKPLMELQPHHFDKTFELTVKSFVRGAQRAAERMPRGSAVVSVSGMDTLRAVPRHGALAAAKSALETLTAYLAHELGPKRIRVNGVNPGFVPTDSTRKYLGPVFDQVTRYFSQTLPTGRAATPEDIAKIILFLCTPESEWIVGQTVRADGGEIFSMPQSSS
jgi:enoyl-[acyl-carrier protein] reductase III